MSSDLPFRQSRRSTRVPLRIVIDVRGSLEKLVCEGETIVVNLHGALMRRRSRSVLAWESWFTSIWRINVLPRGVVYLDPEQPLNCGIELDQPRTSGGCLATWWLAG
jgi:hypothetical protein